MMYTRVVFISRLSAIGDVIIAARAIYTLKLNGYFPILITSSFTQTISEFMPYLTSVMCIEKDEKPKYYLRNEEQAANSFQEVFKENFFHSIHGIPVEKRPIFLDLQKTARSKRALKRIKYDADIEKIYSVSKKTWYRLILILFAYIFFNQKKKNKNFSIKEIETIQDLQQKSIKKISMDDKKDFLNLPYSHLILEPTKNVQIDIISRLGDYVYIFPGASSFIKMWPKENFRELITLILNNTKFSIVLGGAKSEESIGEYLDFPKNDRIINLINKIPLEQTLNLIFTAKYVVSNDSFAAHAAEFFQIPATVLFGSTSPKFGFAPKADYIKIEYLNLNCSPCTRHGKNECRFQNLNCLREIRAIDVFKNMNLN